MYEPLTQLPVDIQNLWGARLTRAVPNPAGAYKLVGIRTTKAGSFEEQRIIVSIVNESGQPVPLIPVAFSYSTADQYNITPDFTWSPPPPQKAFIVSTGLNGTIDQIQGSAVHEGEPGGVTVYILDPRYSSDVVSGAGMLSDHTGLALIFQLKRAGVKSIEDRLAELEKNQAAFASWVTWVEGQLKIADPGK